MLYFSLVDQILIYLWDRVICRVQRAKRHAALIVPQADLARACPSDVDLGRVGVLDAVHIVRVSLRYGMRLEPALDRPPFIAPAFGFMVDLDLELGHLLTLLREVYLSCLLHLKSALAWTTSSHSAIEQDCPAKVPTDQHSIVLLITCPAGVHLYLCKVLMDDHAI